MMKKGNLPTPPSGSLDYQSLRGHFDCFKSLYTDAQRLETIIRKVQATITPEFIANAVRRDLIENAYMDQSHKNELKEALSYFSFSVSLKTREYNTLRDLVSNIDSYGANTYKFRLDGKSYNSINQVIVAFVSKLAKSLNYGYADLKRLFAKHNVTDSLMKLQSEINEVNRKKYPNVITLKDNTKVCIWNNWYFYGNFQPILEMAKAMGIDIKIIS